MFSVVSRDTTVKIWDLITLRELQSLGGHTGSVTDVVILSCSDTGRLGSVLSCFTHLFLDFIGT